MRVLRAASVTTLVVLIVVGMGTFRFPLANDLPPLDSSNYNYLSGLSQFSGLGTKKNLEQAKLSFERAAHAGHIQAMNVLGAMYLNGWGEARNPGSAESAREWFDSAATQNYAPAQNNLGIMYLNGWGGEGNRAEAAQLFFDAAQQGYAPAKNNFAILYLNSTEMAEDYDGFSTDNALDWLTQSANADYAAAQNNLAVILLHEWKEDRVARVGDAAVELLQKAANRPMFQRCLT